MGMDDVLSTMETFIKELECFNTNLKSSYKELNSSHEKIEKIWDDAMRKRYNSIWFELEEQLKLYIDIIGDSNVEQLIEKMNAIKGYLYGN